MKWLNLWQILRKPAWEIVAKENKIFISGDFMTCANCVPFDETSSDIMFYVMI